MNRLPRAAWLAALCLALLPRISSGEGRFMECGPVLGLGAWNGCNGWGANPGDTFSLVGFIESFGPPFEDQMLDDRFEFTLVVHIPVGSVFVGHGGLAEVDFMTCNGATLELYKNLSGVADWEFPETFSNGRRILTATMPVLEVQAIYPQFSDPYGKIWGTVIYTGGILFDRVSENGVGETGEFGGLWNFEGVEPPLCEWNYFGTFDIAMTLGEELPVSVSETTWGRLKRLGGR